MMAALTAPRLLSYLDERKQEMAAFLARLARIETPSLVLETHGPLLSLLADSLRPLGYCAEVIPGRMSGGYLHAWRATPASASQLVIGHCDTVWPVGTVQTMPVEVNSNRVTGPGVYDMKGGLTQMVFALQALHDLKLRPLARPHVLINSDEEVGSAESRPVIESLAREASRAYVLEPSLGRRGQLKTRRKGVGKFRILVKGRAAHAGLEPEKGASAILELAHVIQGLFALNDPQRGVTVNVGQIDGGLSANVVAPESTAYVDVRVANAEDAALLEAVIRGMQPATAGVTLDIEGDIGRPPLERTPRNQALWRLARELGQELGVSLEEGAAGGGSDGNTTSLFTATLDGLGAVGGGAHAEHEFVYIDKMVERAALLALLLLAPPIVATSA